MKKFYSIVLSIALSIFCCTHIWAQSTAGENLDVNNINALLRVTGDHFWDLVNSPKYEIPKGSRKNTIFASALWIGGMENNNLHIAAMTYRQSGSDFWPGPLDTLLGTIDVANSEEWDKMWKVSKAEIETFKKDKTKFTDAIKTWPAHGNTSYGQAKYLAPFVDVDNDGIYDYTKGDYPKIKGDQAIWWIFNDRNLAHNESEGEALAVEIHAMAYAFASTDPAINNTIFFEYDIINRSKNNYKDVYLGIWTDFDLGYAFDDVIGCDSALSAYFVYNADSFDDGNNGYGSQIPVQSVVFLKDSMTGFIASNNNFTNSGNPDQPLHFYNYLTAHYKNGDSIINPRTNKATTFQYSGNPVNQTGWVADKDKAGDRRSLGSTGPFELKSYKKHTFNFAYLTTYKAVGSTNDNLAQMYTDLAKVKNYYKNVLSTSTPEEISKTQSSSLEFSVYPNPTANILTLQWNNSKADNVRLVNMLGQTIWNQAINGAENKITLDTKHFPRGIYMAVIENGSAKLVKRIILQ